MIIAKFGGTSVSTQETIQTIGNIAENLRSQKPVLVVSAVSKITDTLLTAVNVPPQEQEKQISLVKEIHMALITSIFPKKSQKEIVAYLMQSLLTIKQLLPFANELDVLDTLVSQGEILSSYLITRALQERKLPARQIIATQCIVTDDHYGAAEFLPLQTKRNVRHLLVPLLKKGIIPVVTGFIGATKHGKTTTLGRGGSDYTASIIGFSLAASEIQIWTDVDGVYTADPRMVSSAKRLEKITFKEASELASFGAKVLHPRTIRPAITAGIPVRVLNTFHPEGKGTLITSDTTDCVGVRAVTCKKQVPVINVYSTEMLFSKGFLKKIFDVFSTYNISVNLVSVSEVSVSVTLDTNENISPAIRSLAKFTNISQIDNNGMVSLIGENIVNTPHLMKNIFLIFDKEKIPVRMISYGATNINISFIMPTQKIDKAVVLLHKNLIINATKGIVE